MVIPCGVVVVFGIHWLLLSLGCGAFHSGVLVHLPGFIGPMFSFTFFSLRFSFHAFNSGYLLFFIRVFRCTVVSTFNVAMSILRLSLSLYFEYLLLHLPKKGNPNAYFLSNILLVCLGGQYCLDFLDSSAICIFDSLNDAKDIRVFRKQ